jgi:hypothetical protein
MVSPLVYTEVMKSAGGILKMRSRISERGQKPLESDGAYNPFLES